MIRLRVSRPTLGAPESARETVAIEVPAASARSRMVMGFIVLSEMVVQILYQNTGKFQP